MAKSPTTSSTSTENLDHLSGYPVGSATLTVYKNWPSIKLLNGTLETSDKKIPECTGDTVIKLSPRILHTLFSFVFPEDGLEILDDNLGTLQQFQLADGEKQFDRPTIIGGIAYDETTGFGRVRIVIGEPGKPLSKSSEKQVFQARYPMEYLRAVNDFLNTPQVVTGHIKAVEEIQRKRIKTEEPVTTDLKVGKKKNFGSDR